MPRSLARTAVHPPHRIGGSRSSKPMNTFVCILMTVIGAVLCGIIYVLMDINGSSDESNSSSIQSNRPVGLPVLPNFGISSNSNNNDENDIEIPPVIGDENNQMEFSKDQQESNEPNDANNINNNINDNKNDNNDNNGNNINNINNIDSHINTIIKRYDLENLVKPDRDNIESIIDENRLIDIKPPSTITNNNENNNNNNIDSNSKDIDGNSVSLDEPPDEEAATHLLRKDIDPTNIECIERFKSLNTNKIFTYNLSLQANKFSNAINAEDYVDWWDFPVQYQTKLSNNKYCNTIHKGMYELHETRIEWFKKLQKDNKVSHLNSNKFDSNGCVIYKKTDSYVQWYPPNELLCHWKNKATFYHTMHGTKIGYDFRNAKNGEHWVWDLSTELNDERQNNKCSCPSNVAFIFADNQNKEIGYRLVERSYLNCNKNCNFFHVAKNYQPWDWYGKIGPVLDLISNKTFQNKFEYVILTDADDQTLIKSPIDIIEKFNIYEADMVIGGEDTSYPQWQREEKGHENRASPWSKHHQHLNAGAFMGKIDKMIPYLEYMTKDYQNFTKEHEEEINAGERNRWRDQTCWRQMYRKFYPKIKVDSLALLWSRVDIYMYDL